MQIWNLIRNHYTKWLTFIPDFLSFRKQFVLNSRAYKNGKQYCQQLLHLHHPLRLLHHPLHPQHQSTTWNFCENLEIWRMALPRSRWTELKARTELSKWNWGSRKGANVWVELTWWANSRTPSENARIDLPCKRDCKIWLSSDHISKSELNFLNNWNTVDLLNS